MNPDQSNQDESLSWQRNGDLCVAYLLGNLDQDAKMAFEQQLADDPDLSERLLQQADTVLGLASTPNITVKASRHTETPCREESEGRQPVAASMTWRWASAIIATAACVALLFQLSTLNPQGDFALHSPDSPAAAQDPSPNASVSSEQTLIARAWADSHADFEDGLPEFAVVSMADSELDENGEFETAQESDIDSKVDWMFVAMRSSTNAPTTGDNGG